MTPRRRAFRLSLRRPEVTREELDEELAFHVEERTRALVARGLTNEHAQTEALRKLGGTVHEVSERLQSSAEQKEKRIDMRERIRDLLDDVRYALRGLARRPAFCAIAIVTLALGIGANTAIFSAVDALLLRALPFEKPERLVDVTLLAPGEGDTEWSWPKAQVFLNAERSYQSIALYSSRQSTLTGLDPERISAEEVSAKYLRTLGIRVSAGSDFAPDIDAAPGARKVAIISDALWQRRFGAEPNVVGKTMSLNSDTYEIIGVLPPGFRGLSGNAQLLTPITARDADLLTQIWSLEFSMVGRLRDGVSVAQATSEAKILGPRVYEATPAGAGAMTTSKNTNWSANARALESIRVAPKLRESLLVLFGAVALVLLIACVNLANLLLGRAATRRQEIAIRLAIGAARKRIVRLLLTESFILALFGGAAGIAVAWIGTRIISNLNPRESLSAQGLSGGVGAVGFDTIHLDMRALLFTLVTTVMVAGVFGLVPALQATGAQLTSALKDDGAGNPVQNGRRLRGVSRRSLAVLQISLAIVLLVGSGLMLRSLSNLMNVDAGFDPANVLTLRLNVPPGVVDQDSLPVFNDELTRRLRALPGVQEVALADCAPVSNACNGTIMAMADRPQSATGNWMVGVHWVTPEWFSALRIPLKRGRMFNAFDRLGTQKVVLMNEAAERAYFKGEDPIGKTVKVYQGGFGSGAIVAGIVGDVRFGTIDSTARPDVYIAYSQSHLSRMMIFVRTKGDPLSLAPAVRRAIKEFAPLDPVHDIRTLEARVSAASAQTRFSATLLAMFAVVALALAVMGIYGVLSFAVVQRTREIGLRIALGADRSNVLALILREGTILATVGVLIGVPAAYVTTRVLRAGLFNVSTGDPATYVAIVVLVSTAALIASWLPARVAVRVDPIIALRRN